MTRIIQQSLIETIIYFDTCSW